jgi:hypothetical protein
VELGEGNRKEVERAGVSNPLLHFREPSAVRTLDVEHRRTMRRGQDFECYAVLIEMYSRRHLSFQTDVVNAVTGMLKVIHDNIGGDLIVGIPSKYLDLVIMWTPAEPLDRITPIGEGGNAFPTWSWAAWTARKQFRLAHNDSGHDDPVREFATSEVDCFTMIHDGELVQVFKTQNEIIAEEILDVSTAQDQSSELEVPKYIPYSMQRTQGVLGPDFGPNVLQFWAYAVHVECFQFADIDGTLISEPEHGNQRGHQYVNSLLDPRGKHCGLAFKPHSKTRYREDFDSGSMEYVLISSFGDSVRRRNGIETIDESVKPFDPHAFPWRGKGSGLVNVMLIEWFGDIAERLTVAQLNRQAWENAKPVKKHIRLV